MKFLICLLALLSTQVGAQATADQTAIRNIIQDETNAWNNGDAAAYSRHFAPGGTCTTIRGVFLTGQAAFLKVHEQIFQGMFKHSTLKQDVVSLEFFGQNTAVVEVLTSLSGMAQTPPGTLPDAQGRLRTRLLQVMVRQDGEWKVVVYHNVDVKPGVPVPEAE